MLLKILRLTAPTNFHNRLVWSYHLPCHCPSFSLLLLGHAKAVSFFFGIVAAKYWELTFCRPLSIPLAKLLLQTTIDVTKHHPSVYVVVFIGLIIQAAVSVWYTFTCISIYVKWTPGSAGKSVRSHEVMAERLNGLACSGGGCSSSKVAGLVFYVTFAYLWMSQVIGNVILCTLAGGVFGGKSSSPCFVQNFTNPRMYRMVLLRPSNSWRRCP